MPDIDEGFLTEMWLIPLLCRSLRPIARIAPSYGWFATSRRLFKKWKWARNATLIFALVSTEGCRRCSSPIDTKGIQRCCRVHMMCLQCVMIFFDFRSVVLRSKRSLCINMIIWVDRQRSLESRGNRWFKEDRMGTKPLITAFLLIIFRRWNYTAT